MSRLIGRVRRQIITSFADRRYPPGTGDQRPDSATAGDRSRLRTGSDPKPASAGFRGRPGAGTRSPALGATRPAPGTRRSAAGARRSAHRLFQSGSGTNMPTAYLQAFQPEIASQTSERSADNLPSPIGALSPTPPCL